MILKALGKAPSDERQRAFQASDNWKGGVFANIEHTAVMREGASYPKLLVDALNRPKNATPLSVLPSVRLDLHALTDSTPQIVWFGHSSYLMQYRAFRVLVDPVLFGNSSPVSFFGKPFPTETVYAPEDIPAIDLLVLSHDHYDHLDYVTLTKLKDRIRRVVCSLGVGSHLEFWGFDKSIITELDWHQTHSVNESLALTALPARHFSGRVFTRNTTLWNSYAMRWHDHNLFLGGDSGYDAQFKRTGREHGPFDIAMLECGQYGKDWPNIHMFPEETAQAALDLNAKQLLPVHWARFMLSTHGWKEPIERLIVAAQKLGIQIVTPRIGGVVQVGAPPDNNFWWKELA